jgi:hypothetical protein
LGQRTLSPYFANLTNVDSRRLYQGYQTIENIQSTANSTYESLQVSWNRRFEGGFTFLGSYVFSKAIDLESADGNSGRRLKRAPAPSMQLAGVDRSLAGVGLDHADLLGPAATYDGGSNNSKVARYFDTSAFASPAAGTFGTAGRNILTGPGLENFDAGLFKDIPVRENKRFQIRWQVFNSLNRANFLNPNASFASSNFGRILTAGSPRIMQLALRFYFQCSAAQIVRSMIG